MSNFLDFVPGIEGLPNTAANMWSGSTNDSLATITASGYMNDVVGLGQVNALDLVYVVYGYSGTPAAELFQVQAVGSSPTNYNLVGYVLPASDPTQAHVASVNGATIVGDVALFSDTKGTIINSGIKPSNASDAFLASVNTAGVVNDIVIFADTNGSIADSTIAIGNVPYVKGISSTFAGGSTSFSIPVTGMVIGDKLSVTLNSASTIVPFTAIAAAGQINVTFASDPGAGTVLSYAAWH